MVAADVASQAEATAAPDVETAAEVTTAPDVARAPDVPVPDAPVIEPASEPVATAPADDPPAKPNQPRKRRKKTEGSTAGPAPETGT